MAVEKLRNYQDLNEDEAGKIVGPEEFIQRQTQRQIGEDVTRIMNAEQAEKAAKVDGAEMPAEVATAEAAQGAQSEQAGDFSGVQDKYGGPAYSQETMARMTEQGVKQDPAEAEREAAIQAAREEGYKEAQAEIQGILAGRSIEQCLNDMTQDIEHLQAEIAQMQQAVYFDPGMKAYQQKQIAMAQGELASMERRRQMVQSLQSGEPERESVESEQGGSAVRPAEDLDLTEVMGPEVQMPEFNPDLDFNMPANPDDETEKAVVSASYANVARDLKSDVVDPRLAASLAEVLKEYNKRQQAKAKANVAEAAQAVKDGKLDISGIDELDVTAGVPRQNSGQEANPATGEASEPREKLSEPERKGKIREILGRIGNSKPFVRLRWRLVRSAAVVLATAMTMIAVTPSTANANAANNNQVPGNSTATESVAADLQKVNAIAAGEEADETAALAEAQETVDKWAALGIDVESIQADQSELDLSKYDVKGIGQQILEGVKAEDGTEVLANGVTGNFNDYYHGDKESANAYGSNPGDLINDKDRDSKTIDAILERYAMNPVGLAAFTSMSPKMMETLGLDESITSIKDDRERGQAVWEWMKSQGGEDGQSSALGMLSIMLVKGQTDMDFYYENGEELTAYITRPEAGYEGSFEQLGVGIDSVKRDHAPQVMITVTFEDGTQEIFDMNINCGFQLNYAKTGGNRKPIVNIGINEFDDEDPDPKRRKKLQQIIESDRKPEEEPEEIESERKPEKEPDEDKSEDKPEEKPDEDESEDKPEESETPETPEEEPTVPAPTTPEVVWPGEEPTPTPTPEPEPEPQPQPEKPDEPEQPKEETPIVKNPDVGQQIIEQGDTAGELEQTADVATTVEPSTVEEVTPPEDNREEKEENMIIESPEAGEAQWEANEAQDATEPLTPDEVAAVVDAILNQQGQIPASGEAAQEGTAQGQTAQGQ